MWRVAGGVVVAVALAGCSMLGLGDDPDDERVEILFESFVLDTGWGYRLAGIYIDSEGDVWRYQRDEPWYPAEMRSSVVREEDLLRKYQNAVRVGSIDESTLAAMRHRTAGAAGGRVAGEPLAFERSGRLDVAYSYDRRARRYDQIFLGGAGDWVARNDTPEARELVEWLHAVKQSVGFE
jgi:hypothetical protein